MLLTNQIGANFMALNSPYKITSPNLKIVKSWIFYVFDRRKITLRLLKNSFLKTQTIAIY